MARVLSIASFSRARPSIERCERPDKTPSSAAVVQPGRLAHGPDEKCGRAGFAVGFAGRDIGGTKALRIDCRGCRYRATKSQSDISAPAKSTVAPRLQAGDRPSLPAGSTKESRKAQTKVLRAFRPARGTRVGRRNKKERSSDRSFQPFPRMDFPQLTSKRRPART